MLRIDINFYNTDNYFIVHRLICSKIDKDSDGFITHEELKKWVEHVSHRYVIKKRPSRPIAMYRAMHL